MSRVKIFTFLLIFLMEYAGSLSAYAEGRLFRSIPSAAGMETTAFTVYDIKRTDDGFVWLGTDRGLLRYDGEHTVRIHLPNADATSLQVQALAPEKGGSVIASTTQGVYRLAPGHDSYRVDLLLDGNVLRATCGLRSSAGISLIGSNEGIVAFLPDGKIRRVTVGRDVLDPSNSIVDMSESSEGILLLAKRGVWRLDPRDLSVACVSEDDRLGHIGVSSIGTSGEKIYIGTRGNGIWSMNTHGGDLREVFGFSKGNVVTSLEISADGRHMYVGTDGSGVAKIALPSEKIVEYARHVANNPVSPRSNQIYSLLADEGARLWIGYYQNGADYTPSWTGPFELMDDPAVFNTRDVPVRALSHSGDRITIGTREGVVVFERNCSTAWQLRSPQLRSEMVISLLDHKGETYIGTYGGGVQILNPETRKLRDLPDEGPDAVFRSGHVFAMATDRNGDLWFGTNEGLFMYSADGRRVHYTSANSRLPEGNIYGIFFDSEGKGWICTEKGLCVYDPHQKRIRTDLFPSSFPHATRYRTVYEDSNHRLYFIPETGMAFSTDLNLSEIRQLSHPMLEGADAKGITEDSTGHIWLTTNRGIFHIDQHGNIVRFGLASGLPSPAFLQGQPVSDGKGHIWFGNSAGLMRLTESNVASSIQSMLSPLPTTLTVNGERANFYGVKGRDGSVEISLTQTSPTVNIGFSTFSYAEEESEVSYLYSLDGGEWQRLASDMSVTIYELAPGSHELKVKSANDSEGDKEMTSIRLRVPYPIWWYVVALLFVVLLGSMAGLWSLHRYRRKKMLKEIAERAAAEEEKTDRENMPSETVEEAQPKKKYASNNLTRTEGREIAKKIDEVMEREKPYLKADLKVGDLADAVGISSHRLSQFFSQHKQQTFYDYVNSYRVEEFKRVAKKGSNLTLSAMAEKAGFSSRASFFRYFKNSEGVSPGEWLKSIGGDAKE